LASETYIFRSVKPGKHTISAYSNENEEEIIIDAEAGKRYFLRVRPKMGMASARVSLKEVNPELGWRLVKSGSLRKGSMPAEK